MKIAIVGCGYSGKILARRLLKKGKNVLASTTTRAKLTQLEALGAVPALLKASEGGDALKAALADANAVVYLAPPEKGEDATQIAENIAQACPDGLDAFVYGSSTGVFGRPVEPEEWVDENTPPHEPHERGQRRLAMERALEQVGLPLRIVRIAGIYGPARTLRASIERESLILFDGAPLTSRIHVEDLVSILEAMTRADAPKMVIACDDKPSTTLEVARYTCELLARTAPEPVPLEDAKRIMSPVALQMRLGGHRCRSLYRPDLVPLQYPTYREGVRAALIAEGVPLD